ncbi:MAG: NAD(P)-binding domain-containing protein [Bacilli bacterium]|nr:NAD(P)-binding domain-containing protein [Bacilli bacterium]
MKNKYNIMVVGPGRWGSFLTWYLDKIGNNVTLYGKSDSINELLKTRTNDYVTFNEKILITDNLDYIKEQDIIVISIPSQALFGFTEEIKKYNLQNKTFVLCMKGIDTKKNKRLSEIVSENVDSSNSVCVWIGPGHVQEFYNGIPNCMVIDSKDNEKKVELVNNLSSDLIRFYIGNDLIGNEIGAASKNVIGIAAGMLDGFGLSTLKGALMSRGTREIARLIKEMGGNELSAYGLCHLGDYEATVFSKFSHNRAFGEMFIKKEPFEKLAEGYYTVKSMMYYSEVYNVDLPICEAVYNILYNKEDPEEVFKKLFSRQIKKEF